MKSIAASALIGLATALSMAASACKAGCGPDPAPSWAAAKGLTCQTYRWGTGDTISEIAPPGTTKASPAYKLYPDNGGQGYVTQSGDYTVNADGAVVFKRTGSVPKYSGPFSLQTCAADSTNKIDPASRMFVPGFYLEVNLTYSSSAFTGDGFKPGFYALSGAFMNNGPYGKYWWEIDNPDISAYGLTVVDWNGGTAGVQATNADHSGDYVANNAAYGVLLVPVDGATYYYNGKVAGTVTFIHPDGIINATSPNTEGYCWGLMAGSPNYSVTMNSLKIWQDPSQAPPDTVLPTVVGKHRSHRKQ